MNNYKSFLKLKKELGDNYDFKLYEMGISALKEIENLQQENKQLKEDYDRIYNENCKLREEHNITDISLLDENEKLQQEVINLAKEVGRWNSYYDDEFNENQKLKHNWNELKEWVNKNYDYYMNNEDYIGGRLCFTDIKSEMQKLERSDSND